MLRDYPEELLAHQAAALYLELRPAQLAHAVAGEQAGSMALHGLGKIYARLAERNDDDVQFTQRATAMYSAALVARPDNHLAANELACLLCRSGRPAEAASLFERAIDAAPSALAYHNLAVAQRKLGMHGQAAANEQESQRLAAWERTDGSRVAAGWSPVGDAGRYVASGPTGAADTRRRTAPRSRIRCRNSRSPRSSRPQRNRPGNESPTLAASLSLPTLDSTKNIRNAYPESRVARPFSAQSPPRCDGTWNLSMMNRTRTIWRRLLVVVTIATAIVRWCI